MSALLAIVGPSLPTDAVVRRMLGTMRARGSDRMDIWRSPEAVLAVSRAAWQLAPEFTGETMVLDAGDCVVIADASLYYRADLRAALKAQGVAASLDLTATELVLAAYRAWGERAAEHLEGDYAFIVWDRRTKRLTCSRDFGGKRPLYYGEVGATLIVASLVSGVVEHPDSPGELNLPLIAETVAQFWSCRDETIYAGVHELFASHTLTWSPGPPARGANVRAHWTPPEIAEGRASSFDEGAEELRHLLMQSAGERLGSDGITAIWMSGGWDSPSVFGAGQAFLQGETRGRELRPVSISYPVGDPGREDELIAAISNHWRAPIEWLDVDSIPLIHDPVTGAQHRDGPYAHTYEHWNRALARASRTIGARVAFDGNGGDQLFAVSDVYLSDLLRGGNWLALAREWRSHRMPASAFAQWAVVPNLPHWVIQTIQRARGRQRTDYLVRNVPAWVRPDFARRHDLLERERTSMTHRPGDRGWRRESRFFLTAPVFPRAFSCLGSFALENGVELRSPLLDARIVEFACRRPREERTTGRETKRLLRHAMRGLLPDHVLAPRTHRTGITSSYSDRQMRAAFPGLMSYLTDDSVLAELGVIDPAVVRSSWERFLRTRSNALKIPLFLTLQVELWLRARLRSDQTVNSAHAPMRVPAGSFALSRQEPGVSSEPSPTG